MRARFAAAPLLAATSLVLAACGGPGGTKAAVEQQASAPITIWVDDTRTKPAQDYASAHPELHATVKSVDNTHGNISAQIALAVKAGKDVPDAVFLSYPDELATMVVNPVNYALPLDDAVGADVLNKFAKGSTAACTFDGKTYCLPNDLAQTVLYYNTTLFTQFGYTVPKTFDDWLALGNRVAQEHPGYSLGSVNSRYGLNGYYGSSGCEFNASSSPTSVTIDVKSTACTRVNDVVGPLLANKTLSTLDPFDAAYTPVVKEGKLLATISPAWMGEYGIKPNSPDKGQWAVAPMPTWPGAATNASGTAGGGIWVVSALSKNRAAAAEFAAGMATDPVVQTASPSYPAATEAADAWLAKVAKDDWYAEDPSAVYRDAAGKISPTLGFVRFQVQAEDAFNATVVKSRGQDIGAALTAFGEQLTKAAQSASYTVKGE
ncbi:carbohydrate ABC transporter substrate-binding protein [Kitasatospora sp. NA04385]|uniref:ABC transporter substrate-binding protein n=1 Tax=Kitasatospora sp. NA04385 TaxID=2742135 RepID=UPI00158FEE52|nr:ABC transporter substrate-binding protein [Kitasatospora sp. NA04385]QKW17742.1 carbohydrate ABC transporter substrate-binding protein [Kitasatospora sp. NA04385]